MMHLTEDQIYHLVEAIGNHETLTDGRRTTDGTYQIM